ncbi:MULTISPECIES: hypothetical protein [Prochlorococcus]|uniref:hypothetical protein n=1 Tax=Prochlorococcus TaxID=1218 RepID=UPI0007B34ABD|nr:MULTISPECIES: hypothetical protein [Prochlorococcus]KZR64820.1 hypothetical protein PMIT1312_01540 [Prochlorococcus marinus str. MIT 1312]KZR79385.1 hypothetical protein PMIT1327_02593 [Prochlorococcus marinus str. MIT 1327]NMO84350.1 RNA methyltransferase [Prochlorococcus sp. P1344]NMP07305.1 RNA methyltransferase [Prochlorococcus sp. P1361]NMP14646.1 RNA methyltransferase [Prochlorococcus sp.P1363]
MNLPDQILLSDLLHHRVRCDQGLDHGPGVMPWMHPPVHRLLGWVSRPSALRVSRDVWRLDQSRGINEQEVFVKGQPAVSDQITLERLPTLLDADLLDRDGHRLGLVADFVFIPTTGKILHYLVSRSDPRLPGSSRWRLTTDRIVDQQPGMVATALRGLDDLPLVHSSVRQGLINRSRHWRDQLHKMGDRASGRLEGWLEDPPWDEPVERSWKSSDMAEMDPLEGWDDQQTDNFSQSTEELRRRGRPDGRGDGQDDPWV